MKTLTFVVKPILAILLFAMTAAPGFAGALKGANGHTASGDATIQAGKVELASDFDFDGGPDVYVAIKSGSEIQLLGKLRANEGAQSYPLPVGHNGAGIDEIILWCKKFSVMLGTAPTS